MLGMHRPDLNQRPLGYGPSELPTAPRYGNEETPPDSRLTGLYTRYIACVYSGWCVLNVRCIVTLATECLKYTQSLYVELKLFLGG